MKPASVKVHKLFSDLPHHPALSVKVNISKEYVVKSITLDLRWQRGKLFDYMIYANGASKIRPVMISKGSLSPTGIYHDYADDVLYINEKLYESVMKAIVLALVMEEW